MLRLRDEAGVALKVWPTREVLAIFRPYCVETIDFDVDLRELQGQERLEALCGFLRAIGRRLRRPVRMTPEGASDILILGYDVALDRVVLLDGQSGR
jgi:hypothetical protein